MGANCGRCYQPGRILSEVTPTDKRGANVSEKAGRKKLVCFSVFFALIVISASSAAACPSGHYRDSLGICWPYGPSVPEVIPGNISCAQWALNPMYTQAVVGINSL